MLQRLKSREGATLLIALGFFLLCAVVGSIVLTAGSTSSGRIAGLSEQEQSYYTVTSAARLMQGEIEGQMYNYVTDTTSGGTTVRVEPSITGGLGKVITELAKECNSAEVGEYTGGRYISIATSDPDFGEVKGTVYMDTDYNITVELYQADTNKKNSYGCTVFVPAIIEYNKNETQEIEIITEANGDQRQIKHTIVTTSLNWDNGKITKAVSGIEGGRDEKE